MTGVTGQAEASGGHEHQVEHLSSPVPLGALLLTQPATGTAQPEPDAVHQRCASSSAARPHYLKVEWSGTARLRPSNCTMEPIKPSVWATSGGTRRAASGQLRPQVRILRLATPPQARLGSPTLDRLGREPHGETAADAQAGIVFSPVGRPLPLLGDAVPAISIGLERHGRCALLLEGLPLRQPTRPRPNGRPVQQDAAAS